MYLAPLNYDRFFKKVFSDKSTAKRFLEDFLDVTIEEIEELGSKHRITDDSKVVEFDYRCKIDGKYIIIDMQQWYKPDVSQRFYMYHAINASLQLEDMPDKVIIIDQNEIDGEKRVKEIKDYRIVEPVLTIIWMADDNLGYKENYISFALMPHLVEEFLKDEKLWKKENIKELLKNREDLIKTINNDTKEIGFLKKNELIFIFQKNIVKKIDEYKKESSYKYKKWFEFADKTKNKENNEKDFEEYINDDRFKEPIRRLCKTELSDDDIKYIDKESEIWKKVTKFERDNFEMGEKKGMKKGRKEGREEGREEGRKEGREEGREEGELKKSREIAKLSLERGIDINTVSLITGLSVEEVEEL